MNQEPHVHGPDCAPSHEPARHPLKNVERNVSCPCPCGSGRKSQKCHGS